MQSIYRTDDRQPETPLALGPDKAAIALDMSKKALWDRTFPRGDIPAIKVGSRVLYPTHLLRRWMNREFVRQKQEAGSLLAEAIGGNANG